MTPPQDDDWWPLLERLVDECDDSPESLRRAVLLYADIVNRPPGGTE